MKQEDVTGYENDNDSNHGEDEPDEDVEANGPKDEKAVYVPGYGTKLFAKDQEIDSEDHIREKCELAKETYKEKARKLSIDFSYFD